VSIFLTLTLAGHAARDVFGADSTGAADDKGRTYFTDLILVTHEGKPVRFYSDMLKDKVVLITGFYVNCETISPRQNTFLSQVQNRLGGKLGRDVFFVSITVDPKRDTPEEVAEYAKVWKARPGWTFLTGKPENVDWVNYKLGQYIEDPENHKGVYLLGNLRTGFWAKIPPQAGPEVLQFRLQQVLDDDAKVGQ
jgi:protein SCO1/2